MPHQDDDALWGITDDQGDYKKWGEMTTKERIHHVAVILLKIIVVLGCLYLFICSLSVMGSAFQILAGKTTGYIFGETSILSNAVVGLIIGILVTVLVQSSSTSTSVVTTMVGARIISVHNAIPIIMGANIGTSVTNTIVALGQSMNPDQFRRAFAGATVHDIFNLLTVLILLPIEVITGMLEKMTEAIVSKLLEPYKVVRSDSATNTTEIDFAANFKNPPDILKVITNPVTKNIVQVNKIVIYNIAKNDTGADAGSILKTSCKNLPIMSVVNSTEVVTGYTKECVRKGIFGGSPISDSAIGAILLILSLIALCICLLLMVKVLQSLMKGSVARVIKKIVNSNFPHPFAWLTGYVAILVGAGMTIIVQSSSVFTSTVTPLVGIGVISLKRMYPLTLGSNIGTTTTSVLAALATDGRNLPLTLQIAFSHFFFNIFGIMIWYPVPFMRHVPIKGAKFLGNTTSKYRWFAVAYLILVFFLIPLSIFGISLIRPLWVMGGVLIYVAVVAAAIIVIKILQNKKPVALPEVLQNWKFLPVHFRSLAPYDRIIMKFCGYCKCCKNSDEIESTTAMKRLKEEPGNGIRFDNEKPKDTDGEINIGYEKDHADESV